MVKTQGGSSPLSLGSRHSVKIEKLVIGGAGLARIDNQVVFVPLTAPGDQALIEISLVKKNYAEAALIKIESPGPDRIQPPCKDFGVCGGCSWQHLSSHAQLTAKQSLVEESLLKFNKNLSLTMLPIVPSPRSFRYRNRIQPQYNGQVAGFKKRNSHDLVNIDDCLLVEEPLMQEWPRLKKDLTAGFTQRLKESQKGAGTKGTPPTELRAEIRLNQNLEIESSAMLTYQDNLGFSQVNRFQNEQIQNSVVELIRDTNKVVYDLYGGSGNFTSAILKAQNPQKIILVEMSDVLAKKARADFHPKKVDVYCSDVELFLKRHQLAEDSIVIVDPPRAGCSEYVMRTLALSTIKKLVYISCHPVSLARDLQVLRQLRPEVTIGPVQTFEMFPQTDHVETVVEISFL